MSFEEWVKKGEELLEYVCKNCNTKIKNCDGLCCKKCEHIPPHN